MPDAPGQQASLYQPPATCTAAPPQVHGAWTASWLIAKASHQKHKSISLKSSTLHGSMAAPWGRIFLLVFRLARHCPQACGTGQWNSEQWWAKMLSNLEKLLQKAYLPCTQVLGRCKSTAKLACQKNQKTSPKSATKWVRGVRGGPGD